MLFRSEDNKKENYQIHMTVNNQLVSTAIGRKFPVNGKQYVIVDAKKDNTTSQGASNALISDNSTIWIMPADSKNVSDRIEVRSGKEVFNHKTRKIVIRDVRTPKKRRSNLTVGRTFKIKNNTADKSGMAFKIVDITEKSAEFEYSIGNKVNKLTLDLVKDGSTLHERLKKAYVESDNSKLNSSQPVDEPVERPNNRSNRRSRRR